MLPFKPFDAGIDLRLQTDRATYFPGDEIAVRVVLKGRAETRIEQGWVGLVATHRYTYGEYRWSGQSRYLARVRARDRAVADSSRFLDARTLWPGSHVERTIALTLPRTAPPTGTGAITSLAWKVRAVVAVRRSNDPEVETPIIVLAPASAHADRIGRAVWLNAPAEELVQASFELATRSLQPGEEIAGRLQLTPRREIEARAVRVELVRREEVSRGEGMVEEEVERSARLPLDGPLAAGADQSFDFTLPVPADACPARELGPSAVRWLLRAVLDRPLRRDPIAVLELNVSHGDQV